MRFVMCKNDGKQLRRTSALRNTWCSLAMPQRPQTRVDSDDAEDAGMIKTVCGRNQQRAIEVPSADPNTGPLIMSIGGTCVPKLGRSLGRTCASKLRRSFGRE